VREKALMAGIMEELPCSAYVLNKIYVCVDSNDGSVIKGRVFHEYVGDVNLFSGIQELFTMMEGFMDEMRFPSASTDSRFFGKARNYEKLKGAKKMEKEGITVDNKGNGKKATFIVQVQYRQNATWQGSIKWVEKDEEQRFRSALELIKIIDSATGSVGL
jgi:hypothetical protein